MNYEDYKHCIPIQIRFADVDRLNHVNNACYLNFLELGRVRYFNAALGDSVNWNEKGFVLARTEIDHIKPVFLNDEVFCFTKVVKLGNKSLTIKNAIVKKENDSFALCAQGIGILVAMDYKVNESIEIPENWRELIQKYEA